MILIFGLHFFSNAKWCKVIRNQNMVFMNLDVLIYQNDLNQTKWLKITPEITTLKMVTQEYLSRQKTAVNGFSFDGFSAPQNGPLLGFHWPLTNRRHIYTPITNNRCEYSCSEWSGWDIQWEQRKKRRNLNKNVAQMAIKINWPNRCNESIILRLWPNCREKKLSSKCSILVTNAIEKRKRTMKIFIALKCGHESMRWKS